MGTLHSIDRVRQELLLGRDDDDLVQWVSGEVPDELNSRRIYRNHALGDVAHPISR